VKATGLNDFLIPNWRNLDPVFGVKVSGKLFKALSFLSKYKGIECSGLKMISQFTVLYVTMSRSYFIFSLVSSLAFRTPRFGKIWFYSASHFNSSSLEYCAH
jgi:hypothetical protein